ncbi:MAG TPA: GTPase [Ktedonobacterales bacterium]|nr:GTPase [Ktedonobacterales bacterium]
MSSILNKLLFGAKQGSGRIGVGTLAKLPANIGLFRDFLGAVNWKTAQGEIQWALTAKIALVGLPNTGKSTLFNMLKGQRLSPVSPEAGTTKMLVRGAFGPFALIDTPGHLPDIMQRGVQEASVIVMLIDGTRGFRKEDEALYKEIKRANKPIIVVVNKIDLMRTDPEEMCVDLAARLEITEALPISAMKGTNVSEDLIPAMIDASPEAAVAIGRELPAFRRAATGKIIRSSTLLSLAAGLEPVPLVDIPILLGTQIRMVLRIAAIYGEPLTASRAREVVATITAGLVLRYAAEEAAKLVPFGGDLVSGAIAAAGTWALGQVTQEYFESGKRLTGNELRNMFRRFYRIYREEDKRQELLLEANKGRALPAPGSASSTTLPKSKG